MTIPHIHVAPPAMTTGEPYFDMQIRVRYAETDRMGLLHHANYFVYFEMGRVEFLRHKGYSYKDMEDEGSLIVLSDLGCKYRRPAFYDDVLTLRTIVERTTHVKIVHRYEVYRETVLLAIGHSTVACVDRDMKPKRLPAALANDEPSQPGHDTQPAVAP